MTRDEAKAEAARRQSQEEGDGFWAAREAKGGDWEVVRVATPGVPSNRPTGAHTESRPKPNEPDDPRPSIIRNIPPFGPGS